MVNGRFQPLVLLPLLALSAATSGCGSPAVPPPAIPTNDLVGLRDVYQVSPAPGDRWPASVQLGRGDPPAPPVGVTYAIIGEDGFVGLVRVIDDVGLETDGAPHHRIAKYLGPPPRRI